MIKLISTVILLSTLLTGCIDKNADGQILKTITEKQTGKCMGGFKYFRTGKGSALFIDPKTAHPVRCSMQVVDND